MRREMRWPGQNPIKESSARNQPTKRPQSEMRPEKRLQQSHRSWKTLARNRPKTRRRRFPERNNNFELSFSCVNLPHTFYFIHTETLQADTSQDIRHLALIDMKGCRYQQLPLTKSQLFRVHEKHAESASVEVETEAEYIEAAQERLHEFAVDPVNAYAGIRFLCMQQSGAKAVQAATEKIVNDLLKLMEDNDLRHVWASWHPHRFAAVAAYAYLFVAAPAKATSQWDWMVVPKRTYIPIDEIQSLPMLASHCPSLTETLGVNAVPPRVDGLDDVTPRVVEAAGQAFATPPVVCELCHKGFKCKRDHIDHCTRVHGGIVK